MIEHYSDDKYSKFARIVNKFVDYANEDHQRIFKEAENCKLMIDTEYTTPTQLEPLKLVRDAIEYTKEREFDFIHTMIFLSVFANRVGVAFEHLKLSEMPISESKVNDYINAMRLIVNYGVDLTEPRQTIH